MFSHTATAVDFADRYFQDAEQALRDGRLTVEQFWFLRGVWSRNTFGSAARRGPAGPLKHLLKELTAELLPLAEAHPNRYGREMTPDMVEALLEEYADAIFLVMDAADRNGFTLTDLRRKLGEKLLVNRARKWGPASATDPVEHVRSHDAPATE